MPREMHETQEDLDNEYTVLDKLKDNKFQHFTKSKKLPISYGLDFMLSDDKGAVAFI